MRIKQTDEEKQILKMIGRNIKFYRINHNCSSKDTDEYGRITQEKLAELAESSASMIANLESETTMQTISIVLLNKIAKALNIPLYAFFLEKPIKNPPKNLFEEE